MKNFKNICTLALLAALALTGAVAGGCDNSGASSSSSSSPSPSSGGGPTKYPYTAVTTVGMVTDIVRQVAGDKATVTGLIGEGIDPHLYNPTRNDVAALME